MEVYFMGENYKHLGFPALYLMSELFNKQSAGFIIISYIFLTPKCLPCSKTDQRDTLVSGQVSKCVNRTMK